MVKLQVSRVADFFNFISSYSQDQELPHCATINEDLVQIYEEDLETLLTILTSDNMETRIGELRACWFLRAERCDPERFMIGLAYKASLSRPSARSMFYTCKKRRLSYGKKKYQK